jgi:tetratricopeptide (TPR) repeat protein
MQRAKLIAEWHDRTITPGGEWAGEINEHIRSADVILLLISADFLKSKYCYDVELQEALARHHRREAVLVPVILRPVQWEDTPFGALQALPQDGKPITTWDNRDAAFKNVADGLRRVIEEMRNAPEHIDARFLASMSEGRRCLAAHDYANAVGCFNGATQLKPDDAAPYFLRGYCRYHLGDYGAAIGDFMLGRRGEREPRVMLFRAATFQHLGELDLAKHECDAAVEMDPLDPEGYSIRAGIHTSMKRFRAAHADLTQAINLSPRDPRLYEKRADLRAGMGERARAVADYRAAAEHAGDDTVKQSMLRRVHALTLDPLQLSDDEIASGTRGLLHLRGLDSFSLRLEAHPLGIKVIEDGTGAERLFVWAELTSLFSPDAVESYVTDGSITITEEQRVRLGYTTVAEPDPFDPLKTPAAASEDATKALFDDFVDVQHWILALAGATNQRGEIDAALPRIVATLRWLEEHSARQIARIPLTTIAALPSETSLALMFCDLAVFLEDSEHMPDGSKTQPKTVVRPLELRTGSREGEVIVGPDTYMNYELAWADRYATLFRDLQPLIDARRVLYLPLPYSTYQHSSRELTLQTLGALAWLKPLVREATDDDLARLHPLVKIELPFIAGLRLDTLARVVADEQDRLAELRVALRAAFAQARHEAADARVPLEQVFRDHVEAKVSSLRRKLNQYQQQAFFKKEGASVESGTIDVLKIFGAAKAIGEALKLLFGESRTGRASYLVGAGRVTEQEPEDPFHVLLRLANASTPDLAVRPSYQRSTLWRRPTFTVSRQSTLVSIKREPAQ